MIFSAIRSLIPRKRISSSSASNNAHIAVAKSMCSAERLRDQARAEANDRIRLRREQACRFLSFSTEAPFSICSGSVSDDHIKAAIQLACGALHTSPVACNLYSLGDPGLYNNIIYNKAAAAKRRLIHRGFNRFSITRGYEKDKININTSFIFTDLESGIDRHGGAHLRSPALIVDVGVRCISHDFQLLCLNEVVNFLSCLKEKKITIEASLIFIIAVGAAPNVSIVRTDTPEKQHTYDKLVAMTGCRSLILIGFEGDDL